MDIFETSKDSKIIFNSTGFKKEKTTEIKRKHKPEA